MVQKLTWTFPAKCTQFLKIEVFTVAILAILVFFFSFIQFRDWFYTVIFTVLFVGVYFALSFGIQKIRRFEEKYTVTSTHFEVVRITKNKTKKEKVPWKKVYRHKLNKVFHGGYMISEKGKHLLFFNTKKELEKFEKFVKKQLKKKK